MGPTSGEPSPHLRPHIWFSTQTYCVLATMWKHHCADSLRRHILLIEWVRCRQEKVKGHKSNSMPSNLFKEPFSAGNRWLTPLFSLVYMIRMAVCWPTIPCSPTCIYPQLFRLPWFRFNNWGSVLLNKSSGWLAIKLQPQMNGEFISNRKWKMTIFSTTAVCSAKFGGVIVLQDAAVIKCTYLLNEVH